MLHALDLIQKHAPDNIPRIRIAATSHMYVPASTDQHPSDMFSNTCAISKTPLNQAQILLLTSMLAPCLGSWQEAIQIWLRILCWRFLRVWEI
mmetsp:Transcript_74849/g.124814  ORF Transcript_74849/g.124814 Transcript_74849/m.124814 type:complete len:93 (+) Transcript_74849:140-418(+)